MKLFIFDLEETFISKEWHVVNEQNDSKILN